MHDRTSSEPQASDFLCRFLAKMLQTVANLAAVVYFVFKSIENLLHAFFFTVLMSPRCHLNVEVNYSSLIVVACCVCVCVCF